MNVNRAIAELREIANTIAPRGVFLFFYTDQQRADMTLSYRLKRIADEIEQATKPAEPEAVLYDGGTISSARVYDVALTPEEVAAKYRGE